MDNKELDQKFKTNVIKLGGIVLRQDVVISGKLTEYLVILPGGCIGFMFVGFEEKMPRNTLNKINTLRRLGCAAGCVTEEKHINDALVYITSRAYRDPDWYRFIAENGKKGETNGI